MIPWPVYVEASLLLHARGHTTATITLGQSLLRGFHTLSSLDEDEHGRALDFLEHYRSIGLDLVDATVMAVAARRDALVLTWDFRHFRAVVPTPRRPWALLVQEHDLPDP